MTIYPTAVIVSGVLHTRPVAAVSSLLRGKQTGNNGGQPENIVRQDLSDPEIGSWNRGCRHLVVWQMASVSN